MSSVAIRPAWHHLQVSTAHRPKECPMEWIIFAAIAVPILGLIAWFVLDDSFVRIEPGQLGLLLIKGRATDIALQPGPHWVPALRRREVQTYPSVEMSYRARLDADSSSTDLEH